MSVAGAIAQRNSGERAPGPEWECEPENTTFPLLIVNPLATAFEE